MNPLPVHLQKSALPRLADHAADGIGASLPPRISIRANEFTLIDAAGAEKPVDTKHLDVCIVDKSDSMCKLYYGKAFEEDSNDPPLCFSMNGVKASSAATQPQNKEGGYLCSTCPQNVRGSAISKLSGVAIKACRDELAVAVLLPSSPDMIFQLKITPGSFVNWKNFVEKFKNQPFDLRDVVTRLQFEAKKNGVLTFTPTAYLDEPAAKARNKAIESKATDIYVGRNDEPIGALPSTAAGGQQQIAQRPIQQEAQAEPEKPKRGRPKKEAEQANGSTASGGEVMAPFRPEAAPAQNTPVFGIQQNAADPPSDLEKELDSFFKS